MVRLRHAAGLSPADELALWLGIRRGSPPARVPDRDLPRLRALWFRHRDAVTGSGVGRRPWGWWQFVACEPAPPAGVAEVARLAELGELSDAEVAELLRRGDEHRRAGHVGSPHIEISDVLRRLLRCGPCGRRRPAAHRSCAR